MLCGAVAGLSQSIVTSPMELVKTRIQLQTEACVATKSLSCAATSSSTVTNCKSYASPLDCIKKIVTTEGWRGMFRGQLITVLRDVSPSLAYSSSLLVCIVFLLHSLGSSFCIRLTLLLSPLTRISFPLLRTHFSSFSLHTHTDTKPFLPVTLLHPSALPWVSHVDALRSIETLLKRSMTSRSPQFPLLLTLH